MINIVSRCGNLAPYLKVTTQTVASQIKQLSPTVPVAVKIVVPPPQELHTSFSLSNFLPSGPVRVLSGPGVTTQVRFYHSDIQVPDFSAYRRKDVKDSTAVSRKSEDARKSFTYLVVGGGAVVGTYAAKTVVGEFVSSMSASADVLALAKIEVKLTDIPEGKSVTFKWRGKPLFIRHRTPSEIQAERSIDIASLRHPEHDADRVQADKWLVIIGVCTHLGCVPIANAGDYGGYYCPCHGSHYDASGRIRKGPAPLNLEVPYYEFLGDGTIVVG